MTTTLIVKNVDAGLLERQRAALGRVLDAGYPQLEDIEQCQGLLNMLDAWSDNFFTEIDVQVREWTDKPNGNSYFSARVYHEGEVVVTIPFQYGYGDHGLHEAMQVLAEHPDFFYVESFTMRGYCEALNIKYTYNKQEGCTKQDVKIFGEVL